MIIRLTLSDNDHTQCLEEFCEGLRNRMFNCEFFPDFNRPERENYDSGKAYANALVEYLDKERAYDKERYRLMDADARYKKGTKDYNTICAEVLRLWKIFAAKDEWLARQTPLVSIQHSLEEGWENGEVVYYFTPYDKFITK